MIDAVYIDSADDNRQVFEIESNEFLDDTFDLPEAGDELIVRDYHRGASFEKDRRYLLFVSEDLSGETPLLRFAFNLDAAGLVPGHDEPATLADSGVRDGRPVIDVVDCVQSELGSASRDEALRQLGRDTDPSARLRSTPRRGAWLVLIACDPGDDGHPEP